MSFLLNPYERSFQVLGKCDKPLVRIIMPFIVKLDTWQDTSFFKMKFRVLLKKSDNVTNLLSLLNVFYSIILTKTKVLNRSNV